MILFFLLLGDCNGDITYSTTYNLENVLQLNSSRNFFGTLATYTWRLPNVIIKYL